MGQPPNQLLGCLLLGVLAELLADPPLLIDRLEFQQDQQLFLP